MDRTPGIRPRPSLWRRLDQASRHSFPAACTALLMLVATAPLGLPDQGQLLPAIAIACVYFWSLFRPASMPPPVVFALGLFADLLNYAPVGVSVLTLLIIHGLALRWRRGLTRLGFVVVWLVFMLMAGVAAALGWGLTALLTFRLLPASAALFQWLLTTALYPVLATLFTRAHRGLAEPGEA